MKLLYHLSLPLGSHILPLVRQSSEVIDKLYDKLYDHLQWRKKYTVDLIPGWKKGRVEGLSALELLEYTKQEICTLFEATLQKEIIAAIKLNGELDGIVDRILAPLSRFLCLPILQQILHELVDHLAPWLDPIVLTGSHIGLQPSKCRLCIVATCHGNRVTSIYPSLS